MKTLANKVISQVDATLRQAYQLRKREYEAIRSIGEWSGAVLYAGTLVELALKIVICKNMDVTHLPKAFQVHDLETLLYCSGLWKTVTNNPYLHDNFLSVFETWSMDLRYEGAKITQTKFDEIHQALFDNSNGLLTFLSSFL
jgi:hypothetical protein